MYSNCLPWKLSTRSLISPTYPGVRAVTLMVSCSLNESCRDAGLASPQFPILAIGRILKLTAVLADVDAVVAQHFEQRIEAGHRRVGAWAKTVTLIDLVHRQPALHVLLRLVVKDVLAAVRAEVELVIAVIRLAAADFGGIIRLGEEHRHLTDLTQHRQRVVVKAVTLLLLLAPELEARTVELVKRLRVLLREPLHLALFREPGVESRGVGEVVERGPR